MTSWPAPTREGCVSPRDSNLNAREDLVRPLLNDPGSMDTISTTLNAAPRPDGYRGF